MSMIVSMEGRSKHTALLIHSVRTHDSWFISAHTEMTENKIIFRALQCSMLVENWGHLAHHKKYTWAVHACDKSMGGRWSSVDLCITVEVCNPEFQYPRQQIWFFSVNNPKHKMLTKDWPGARGAGCHPNKPDTGPNPEPIFDLLKIKPQIPVWIHASQIHTSQNAAERYRNQPWRGARLFRERGTKKICGFVVDGFTLQIFCKRYQPAWPDFWFLWHLTWRDSVSRYKTTKPDLARFTLTSVEPKNRNLTSRDITSFTMSSEVDDTKFL